jgi:hypothetical protein
MLAALCSSAFSQSRLRCKAVLFTCLMMQRRPSLRLRHKRALPKLPLPTTFVIWYLSISARVIEGGTLSKGLPLQCYAVQTVIDVQHKIFKFFFSLTRGMNNKQCEVCASSSGLICAPCFEREAAAARNEKRALAQELGKPSATTALPSSEMLEYIFRCVP